MSAVTRGLRSPQTVRQCCCTAMAVLLALCATPVLADRWSGTEQTGSLEFEVSFEGAKTSGRFQKFDVLLEQPDSELEGSRLSVQLNVSSATLGSADIDQEIQQPTWFDAAQFPVAQFSATMLDVSRQTDSSGRARLDGQLLLKGVVQAVSIPLDWSQQSGTLHLKGKVALSRIDFNIGLGEWAGDETIAHEVRVRFDVSLRANAQP